MATLPTPQRKVLTGRSCRLEPLAAAHFDALYDAWAQAEDGRDWTYLSVARPASRQACRAWLTTLTASEDPLFFTVVDRAQEQVVGTVALMRLDPANGVAEIGWVNWSRAMRCSRLGTEAIALLLGYLFDTLGYRRCEWKCDSLNAPSREAASRLEFHYEARSVRRSSPRTATAIPAGLPLSTRTGRLSVPPTTPGWRTKISAPTAYSGAH